MEFLELFDAANACDCYSRTSSIQPQQALALINSELTKSLSRQLEKRLWSSANSNASESEEFDTVSIVRKTSVAFRSAKVAFFHSFAERKATIKDRTMLSRFVLIAFLQVLNREPRDEELTASLQFLEQQASRLMEFDGSSPGLVPAERARENLLHALMNHNDFVTIR